MSVTSGVERVGMVDVITFDHDGLLEFARADTGESVYLCPAIAPEREYWEILAWILGL